MSTEDGTTFRPSYIPAEEVLVSYFKNDSGTILWSVRQEDTIEGSKTILTAWDTTDGTVRFQCDTTQPAFVKVNSNPSSLYEKMTWGFDNIIYENGGTYLIRSAGCDTKSRNVLCINTALSIWSNPTVTCTGQKPALGSSQDNMGNLPA